ncbi:MAG: alanine--tRNA ligase [Anaerolineae bacterium]|nr:alanine--tRNA ligase [Anaerolineae bacterium]
MKYMTSAEVRQAFLDFFEEMGHRRVPSSSLVPADDPTLLFTNAGMVQFKDVFLGTDKRDYKRATSSQRSMRVQGKHSDLENVGPSPRHHTFFEMLGNFSFGDYFKRDAIHYAYTLLTKVYGLPPERLVYTVYENDDEAYNIWTQELGISPQRVARMGPKTNFWQMADTGPCGPTTEIHWDKQPEQGAASIVAQLQAEDDRFLEIWNLVFMQFNRTQADPAHSGQFDKPLPAPGVDTGMGLERIVSIMQGVTANYETDLFMPIIRATQALTQHTDAERDANIVPYRVIADHVRAAVFMIADGVLPGAKGRDAVCRLVIRRAARFGQKLGFHEPFLGQVAQAVIEVMGTHYHDLVNRADLIKSTITLEEERFLRTMARGLEELNAMLDGLPAAGTLDGERAFYLKATLGLPIQVTKDVAEERGYFVDMAAFTAAEEQHSLVSGGGQAMGVLETADFYSTLLKQLIDSGELPPAGVNYDPYTTEAVRTRVVALLQDGRMVNDVIVGDRVEVILAATPFYVEAGGQVSDQGVIVGADWIIDVEAMKKPVSGLVVHVGEVVEGNPTGGDEVNARINAVRRHDILRNHTATHLLHAALRNTLGTHVQQRGSLVAPERLRFDFSHNDRITAAQLAQIEAEINQVVLLNYPVKSEVKSLDKARAEGAMALFGEKYGDTVRTVIIDNGVDRYSYELCGGTHVKGTGEIGGFVLTAEGSVSAGIRRVEALTGRGAAEYVQQRLHTLNTINQHLGTTVETVLERISALQEEASASRKQIVALQSKLAKYHFDELMQQMETLNGKTALIARIDNVAVDTLREMADWFRNKVKANGVLVLGSSSDDKPMLLVAVTDDLVKKGVKAGDLIKPVAEVIGGSGGGRPNMAQAGGKDAAKLPEALQKARDLLAQSS